jgi:hypothetical protein
MVDFNDRRSWTYTSPGDEDWQTPLDLKSAKAANARLRQEDQSERFGMPYHVTNKAISKARKELRGRRTPGEGAEALSVGEYMSKVQDHIGSLVHQDVYDPRRGVR